MRNLKKNKYVHKYTRITVYPKVPISNYADHNDRIILPMAIIVRRICDRIQSGRIIALCIGMYYMVPLCYSEQFQTNGVTATRFAIHCQAVYGQWIRWTRFDWGCIILLIRQDCNFLATTYVKYIFRIESSVFKNKSSTDFFWKSNIPIIATINYILKTGNKNQNK